MDIKAKDHKPIRKRLLTLLTVCAAVVIVCVANTQTAHAGIFGSGLLTEGIVEGIQDIVAAANVDEAKVTAVLTAWSNRFVQNTMMKDVGRAIGWNAIIRPLTWIADKSQGLYMNTLGLVDFTNWGSGTYKNTAMQNFMDNMQYLFAAVLAISLVYLGIVLIVDHEKRPKILTSVVLAAFCFSGLGWALTEVNQLIPNLATSIINDGEEDGSNIAMETLASHLYDLYDIEERVNGLDNLGGVKSSGDFGHTSYNIGNAETVKEMWDFIDFNEVVNPESELLVNQDEDTVLNYYVVYTTSGTNIVQINDGMNLIKDSQGNGLFNNFYYRWTINWFPAIITLCAVIALFVCLAYKVIRLIIEILISRVLAMLYSADLNGAQKTLRILRGIVDSYIVLLLTAVLIKVFFWVQQYLDSKFSNQPFVNSILLLFATMAIIDGPNIVQQVTGIDAGINSTMGRLAGGLYAANTVGRAAAGAVRGGVRAGRAIGHGVSNLRNRNGGGENGANGASKGKDALNEQAKEGNQGQPDGAKNQKAQQDPNAQQAQQNPNAKTEPNGTPNDTNRSLDGAGGSQKGDSGIQEDAITPNDARDSDNKQMEHDIGGGESRFTGSGGGGGNSNPPPNPINYTSDHTTPHRPNGSTRTDTGLNNGVKSNGPDDLINGGNDTLFD